MQKNELLRTVNFDNAATTFPKPREVRDAVLYGMTVCGGNPGRGGHRLSMQSSEAVYQAREAIAGLFGGEPEHVVFTANCTHALNLAIHGVMAQGGHVIISDLEHNSVSRPVAALAQSGRCTYSVAHVSADDRETVENFRRLITPHTKAVVITLASNVTGQILPWKQIAALCRRNHICCIADGAQVCGVLPVSLSDGINILCAPGHKGLYGISGTGFLLTDGSVPLPPLMYGGTGSTSLDLQQPDFLPDALESGTVNTVGAISLHAGIGFLSRVGLETIHEREVKLCERLIRGLRQIPGTVIYRQEGADYVPIVAFRLEGQPPEETAQILSSSGFCLRAGYQCAALAHRALGTEAGVVRFAPGAFSRADEVDALLRVLHRCRK